MSLHALTIMRERCQSLTCIHFQTAAKLNIELCTTSMDLVIQTQQCKDYLQEVREKREFFCCRDHTLQDHSNITLQFGLPIVDVIGITLISQLNNCFKHLYVEYHL